MEKRRVKGFTTIPKVRGTRAPTRKESRKAMELFSTPQAKLPTEEK